MNPQAARGAWELIKSKCSINFYDFCALKPESLDASEMHLMKQKFPDVSESVKVTVSRKVKIIFTDKVALVFFISKA